MIGLTVFTPGKLPMAHVEAGHRTATLCQLCNIGYELTRTNLGPKERNLRRGQRSQ